MKKEIDAALTPILGGADSIGGPVGPSAVAVTAEIGLDAVAGSPNNRPVIATIRAALREEGWKAGGPDHKFQNESGCPTHRFLRVGLLTLLFSCSSHFRRKPLTPPPQPFNPQ